MKGITSENKNKIILKFCTNSFKIKFIIFLYGILNIYEKKIVKILTILIRWPIASAGRFFLNLALTEPEHPWGLVTLPQIALILDLHLTLPGTGVLFFAFKK